MPREWEWALIPDDLINCTETELVVWVLTYIWTSGSHSIFEMLISEWLHVQILIKFLYLRRLMLELINLYLFKDYFSAPASSQRNLNYLYNRFPNAAIINDLKGSSIWMVSRKSFHFWTLSNGWPFLQRLAIPFPFETQALVSSWTCAPSHTYLHRCTGLRLNLQSLEMLPSFSSS
jgi:hypothetical protein